MAVGNANFAELLWPGIKEIFGYNYTRYPTLYSKYMSVSDSKLAFEKYQGVTGLGLSAVKAQGEDVTYADPMLGYQTIIEPVTYALGMAVTREMYDDDQYNYINKAPKMLSDSMTQTEEVVSANLLNNGFSTSTANLGADGKALFSTTHPLVDQTGSTTTYKNTLSTAADFTQTSLEQALVDIGNFVDDRGRNIQVKPKLLINPVDLQFQVQKVLKTENEVDSANNTINPVKGMMPSLTVPYLTDTDAWFILTDVDDALVFLRRQDATLARENEFDTLNLKFLVWARFGVGFVQPRGAYGSPGA